MVQDVIGMFGKGGARACHPVFADPRRDLPVRQKRAALTWRGVKLALSTAGCTSKGWPSCSSSVCGLTAVYFVCRVCKRAEWGAAKLVAAARLKDGPALIRAASSDATRTRQKYLETTFAKPFNTRLTPFYNPVWFLRRCGRVDFNMQCSAISAAKQQTNRAFAHRCAASFRHP